jgi:hypothetical protein
MGVGKGAVAEGQSQGQGQGEDTMGWHLGVFFDQAGEPHHPRAFSLVLCTIKSSEVRLFVGKRHARSGLLRMRQK